LSGASSDMLIDAGTFEMGSLNLMVVDSLTISDTATLTDATGTLTVGGATEINGTFSTSDVATHHFTILTINADGIYNNGTNPVTVNATGTVTNNGTVTLGSGTIDFTDGLTNANIFTSTPGKLKIVGNLTNTGTFNHNGGMITFGGEGTFTPGSSTYNHITKTSANTTTTLGGNLTLIGILNVDEGAMELSSYAVSVGSITIDESGTLTQGTNSSLSVSGNFTNDGTYTPDASSSLSLTGTGTLTPGDSDYSGTLLTSGTVTLAEGATFNFAGATWTNTGTFTVGNNSTVKFNRTGTGPIGQQTLTTGGAPNVPAMNFVNIETDNDGTITFATAINLSGTFTIAGTATVRDVTPGSVYNFAETANVVVSGNWILTGSAANHIQLLGIGGGDDSPRWTLTLNSSGMVDINYVDLRDSELITHGGSMNGKNVNYTVSSLGNLSPSWGPFDPVPVDPESTEPSELAHLGDANSDGVIDLADFSILAAVFGTADSRADFNDDGFVTLADFSILATNFGKTVGVPAAPVAKTEFSHSAGRLSLRMSREGEHTGSYLHRGDVVEATVMAEDASLKAYNFALGYDASMLQLLAGGVAEGDFLKDTLFVIQDGRVFSATRSDSSEGTGVLTKLRFRVVADGVSDDAIALRDVQVVDSAGRFIRLPELHAAISTVPHKTRLLANYPNPFNPETWIPFELADDAKVNIQIYDVIGRLIRTIDLGHRPAGHYVDRSETAYWDGHNSSGERVASGMYLYRLTAEGRTHRFASTAMRRMVIFK